MSSSNKGPLYQQIRDILHRSIHLGELKPHDRVGSEFELAEQFGVSRVTSRQALSQLEQEGMIYRIQGKGSFVAEVKQTESEKELPPTIGVLVPFIHDSFTMRMVEGIEKQARESGFRIFISSSDNDLEQETELIKQIRSQGVSGLIIWQAQCQTYNEAILRLKLDGYPFVLVDSYMENVLTDYVISDNIAGGFSAAQHLLQLKHTRVGFVSSCLTNTLTERLRYKGFQKALQHWGFEMDETLRHELDSTKEDYLANLREYLRNQRPSAIFASNDIIAMMVLRAAYEEGIVFPEELSLVGFDNLVAVAHLQVPLTSVDQNVQLIGRRAAEIIVNKIRGEAQELVQVVIPTELVVRDSCRLYSPKMRGVPSE